MREIPDPRFLVHRHGDKDTPENALQNFFAAVWLAGGHGLERQNK